MYFQSIEKIPTKLKQSLVTIPLHLWDSYLVQRIVDDIAKKRGPSAAKHAYSFVRLVFKWAKNRGYCNDNPAQNIELPKERKRQRLPDHDAFIRLLDHAKMTGTHKQRTPGSCAYFIWIMMELEYLCRMRGIECRRLSDANLLEEGILINRTKGSRDNIVMWNSRLKSTIEQALVIREEIWSRHKRPIPMDPKHRYIVVNTSGDIISDSGYHSAWQRFIKQAIHIGIITEEERFSPHDLKRKGITDTKGTRHDKQEASGHKSEQMLDVYDKSIPVVKPAAD